MIVQQLVFPCVLQVSIEALFLPSYMLSTSEAAVPSRPLLLLLDGHSPHHNPEVARVAKENDIILFTLGPHTTHEMQPLDTAVFGPLKAHCREACHKYIQNNPGMAVTKYQFSSLLSEAWMNTMSPSTIISCFKEYIPSIQKLF